MSKLTREKKNIFNSYKIIKRIPVYKCNVYNIDLIKKITNIKLKFYFSKFLKWKNSINKELQCPICFNNISEFDNFKLNCEHIFCRDCLKKWIFKDRYETNCPLCRKKIFNNYTNLNLIKNADEDIVIQYLLDNDNLFNKLYLIDPSL